MTPTPADALAIWHAGVAAVRPEVLLPGFLTHDADFRGHIDRAKRVIVVGGGKAGAAMAAAFETALPDHLSKITGLLNVPADAVRSLQRITLHPGRPAGSNHPTADGVAGADRILDLLRTAGPDDVAVCLLSGGGSALLPAPDGVTLEDKQAVTKRLHGCGATINEMNAVRKHLSRLKGGRLAQAFTGRRLFSLIISDVVGDPLDVIASGPTAVDPTTFIDAINVLEKYKLMHHVPAGVVNHFIEGMLKAVPETLKHPPANVRNVLLGNSAVALRAAQQKAESLGYITFNAGEIDGDTGEAARQFAAMPALSQTNADPRCYLSGGETTVTLGQNPGKGGRNQEFVLAMLHALGDEGMKNVVVLSGGTDGEDGPTDAAGAVADEQTLIDFRRRGVDLADALDRHDAYNVFEPVGALIKTGLTDTNVMDLRVILVGNESHLTP